MWPVLAGLILREYNPHCVESSSLCVYGLVMFMPAKSVWNTESIFGHTAVPSPETAGLHFNKTVLLWQCSWKFSVVENKI